MYLLQVILPILAIPNNIIQVGCSINIHGIDGSCPSAFEILPGLHGNQMAWFGTDIAPKGLQRLFYSQDSGVRGIYQYPFIKPKVVIYRAFPN